MPLLLVAFTLPESLLTSMVTRPCSLVNLWRWCANQELTVTYLNSGGKVGDTLKAIVTCDKCESYLHRQGRFPEGTNTRMQLEKHWHIPPSNSQTAKEKSQRVAATQSKSSHHFYTQICPQIGTSARGRVCWSIEAYKDQIRGTRVERPKEHC